MLVSLHTNVPYIGVLTYGLEQFFYPEPPESGTTLDIQILAGCGSTSSSLFEAESGPHTTIADP
jgi:hypothetical protein